ncbi:MAG: helix-turn-helix transcriptional regulator [Oscillospiraceae bacterium]|nr:helix-turn-helix transcriptional regulator [Oscillospiraceae bacterium]
MIIIKNRLRELREAKKYTQLKVALDLNLNQNSISRYENGSREAGYDLLIRFSDYYGVSIDYLLYRTDNPKINK